MVSYFHHGLYALWPVGMRQRRDVSEHAGRVPVAARGMTLSSDRDFSKEPRRKTAESTGQGGSGKSEMGDALRAIYQKTVQEAIPDEMLDLLGKLG